jgi:hypothetical protein
VHVKVRSLEGILLYNESIKRDLQTRPINECRGDERLKTKTEESTRLVHTGNVVYYESITKNQPSVSEECRFLSFSF